MNPHFITERERTAKAFQGAVKAGAPDAIGTIGAHLARCAQNIHIAKMVECLGRAAEHRCLAMDETDNEKARRHWRESALAEQEAGLIWSTSPGQASMLTDAAIQEATAEQLGAHAWLVYAGYAGEEVSAGS